MECKKGYEQLNGSCEGKLLSSFLHKMVHIFVDIDECKEENSCNNETEICDNLPGTFMCKCKPGYEKVEGKCEVVIKKPKKKKNTPKSRKSTAETVTKPTPTEGNTREKYSFFHILGPLLISLGVYWYIEPNLIISCSLLGVIILTIILQ